MKLTKLFGLAAALLLTSGVARAVHVWEDPGGWWTSAVTHDSQGPLFTANELSLDLSGSYIAHEGEFHDLFKTDIKGNRGRWGGNVGLNYFFTRNLGIGGDFNLAPNGSGGGEVLDQALGSLILRFPIDPTGFAPYILGGGGRGLDNTWQWLFHVGGGLEYRFNPVTGIFADARFIWSEHRDDSNAILFRTGLRIAF